MSTFPSSVDLQSIFDAAGSAPDKPGGSLSGGSPFDSAVSFTLGEEGGYVANDAGKGETNFGINKSANPDVNIKGLTQDGAKAIYKTRYWDAIGGDNIAKANPQLATVAFDTAVNMGPTAAKNMLRASGGDPAKLLQLREEKYQELLAANPEKFGPYAQGWSNRLTNLRAMVPDAAPAATAGQKFYEPRQAGKYVDITQRKNASAMDVAKEFFASAVEGVGAMGQFAGEGAAAVANAVTGTEDFAGKNLLKPASTAIRNSMTEGGKQAREGSNIEGSVTDLFNGDAKLPDNLDSWMMLGAGGFGSMLTSIIPIAGPASKVISLTKQARAAELAGDVAKAAQLTKAAESAAVTSKVVGAASGAAMTGGSAAEDVRETAAKSVASMSHEQLLQVPVYAEAFNQSGNEQQARDAVVNGAARWAGGIASLFGAAGGAFNAKVLEDFVAKKGMSSLLGSSVGSRAGRGVIGGGVGVLAEGGQETSEKVGQNIGENIGLGRDPTQNALRNTAGDFVGGALVGGPVGTVGGVTSNPAKPAEPVVPPALKPVADKAAEGGTLSKAAMAGQTLAIEAPPVVDPVSRLAELESIGVETPGAPARAFTPEELSEYQELIRLRDATPGMDPAAQKAEVDDIFDRASAIEAATRTNNGLNAFRQDDSPVNAKQFLNDLAIAKSKSSNAAQREQALSRLEFAADWAGFNIAPAPQRTEMAGPPTRTDQVMGMAANVTPQDRSAIVAALDSYRNPRLPEATRQAALAQALEIVGRYQAAGMPSQPGSSTPAVLGDIPPTPNTPEFFLREAERRENGAFQFMALGFTDEANALKAEADSLREQAASARMGELGKELTDEDADGIVTSALQQTVDEATNGLTRASIPPMAAGEKLTADNTAARRKRQAQVGQLVGIGFETVERRDKDFFLVNAKTKQEVKLDGMADAQLARTAIAKMVDERANTAASSPKNDRLEPTEAQIAAGNYKKSDVIDLNGMKITIENPAGSVRRGVAPDGKAWESTMAHHYGEFLGTEGADGDRLDVFIGPRPDNSSVFVIDQVNPDGSFDEHKVVMGVTSEEQARATYLANYEKGWTGLGAITEMPIAEFKAWAKSERAKQPLMLGKQDKLFTVTDNGMPVQLMKLDTSEVGDASAPRTGSGRAISKKDADLVKAVGAIFGMNVQFFRPVSAGFSADGFVRPQDKRTIYLNERTTISPLAVFGHEFMHLIKLQNPKAYAAMSKVVRALVKDPQGYRADYYGKDSEQAKSAEPLNDAELEELMSDLNGNFMTDSKFWGQVFAQIQKDYGKEAKGIIAQLSAFLTKSIDMLVTSLKGQNFNAGKFVNDTKAVRAAFKEGLVQYAKESGVGAVAIQAEILRQQQKTKGVDIRRDDPSIEDATIITKSPERAQSEYDAVVAKYQGSAQWLKAPNGNATNLSERQWVQVRTPAFQAWFGPWEKYAGEGDSFRSADASWVVDANGEPLVVYHGATKGGFMVFERPSGEGRGDLGIFTAEDEGMAESYVRRNRVRRIAEPQQAAEQTGWRYIKNTTGEQIFQATLGDSPEEIATREKAYNATAVPMYGDDPKAGDQPGVYALFVNIRNPSETDFEGANWDGSRGGQFVIFDENGDRLYAENGQGYFTDEERDDELARLEAQGISARAEEAPEHYESTDSVVRQARRDDNDGAIIRQVRDDGGGPGYSGDPSDVFVAFEPNQLKSADFNGGGFTESEDIRKSTAKPKRAPKDAAIEDRTDVAQLPQGRAVPPSAALGGLEQSLGLARSKSYRRGRDLKQDIQTRVLAAARSARVNLNERTQSTFKFLSGMVFEDAKFALKSNENAVGWYDQKVSRAMGALSTVHPEINTDPRARLAFLWALAATSNGLKVNKNFELAERAYRAWKATATATATGIMPTDVGVGNAAQAINKGLGLYNTLVTKVGDERMLKFMGTKFEVGQIQNMLGLKVGGEWTPTPVRGSAILGPKIGNGFFSNLNGYFDALTMDRWLMRTWGRMTGTLLEVTRQDIDKSRRKLASKIADLSDVERRSMSALIGRPIRKNMTRADLDAVSKASQKASMKTDKRELMMASDATNEFRKSANLHHMTMDGQKEAPSGPAERNWIRAVFQDALDKLQADGKDMTMSDLQALLWYPERRLYDAAKSDEDVADGYEDDEAPDYANAAYDMAIANGVDRTRVLAAMDAAEARGTVQGQQLTDAEKQDMIAEFRSPPKQAMQLVYEVAPDPDDQALTNAWNALPGKERERITSLVHGAVLADVAEAVGVKVGKTVKALGGFEGQVNPNLITQYKPKEVAYTQARALAAAIGIALDQKSVVIADPRLEQSNGMVRITLSSKAEKLAPAIMKAVGDATGAYDFTARGNSIDVMNFTGLSTESFAAKISDAVNEYDVDLEFGISFGDVKSELIEKETYEAEVLSSRPGPGREILERVRRARDRAREILAAELRGRQLAEVPGSAGGSRRAAAESADAIKLSPNRGRGLESSGDRDGGRLDSRRGDSQGEGSENGARRLAPLPGYAHDNIQGAAGPDQKLVEVAEQYALDNGFTLRRQAEYVEVDPRRAARIADAYAAMPHAPQDPAVKAAYKNLIQQITAQYRALEKAGYKFYLFDETSDPYGGNPWNAMRDLRANRSMGVFATEAGFGSNANFDPNDNLLLEDTGLQWPWGSPSGRTKRVLANDLFRAVHDAFGHGLEGAGFRERGEENAWQAHVRLFTGSAVGAITSETRGQNSRLNYGPNGEANRTAKVEDTVFAEQKTGLMPDWTWNEGRAGDEAVAGVPAPNEAPRVEPVYKDDIDPAQAKGRKVVQEVEIEDTGKTGKLSVDGGNTLDAYNQRVAAMKQLLECLRK